MKIYDDNAVELHVSVCGKTLCVTIQGNQFDATVNFSKSGDVDRFQAAVLLAVKEWKEKN